MVDDLKGGGEFAAYDKRARIYEQNIRDGWKALRQKSKAEGEKVRDDDVPQFDWKSKIISAQKLGEKSFPALRYIVPGMIVEGLTLLVSRPKLGKTWFLQQLAAATATGNKVFASVAAGDIGDVLCLSLEDGQRRMQRRMSKHFIDEHKKPLSFDLWPDHLTMCDEWPTVDQGGYEAMREWCQSVKTPKLITIDTLKKIKPRTVSRNKAGYDIDYESVEPLMKLTQEFAGLGIIVAHHDRKLDADDVFDTVSGTLGLQGSVDAIAIMKKTKDGTTLHIKGRDLEDDVEKAISFDREACKWNVLGDASEVHRTQDENRVLRGLEGAPMEGIKTKDLADSIGWDKPMTNLSHLLGRMADKKGLLTLVSKGYYRIADGVNPPSKAAM